MIQFWYRSSDLINREVQISLRFKILCFLKAIICRNHHKDYFIVHFIVKLIDAWHFSNAWRTPSRPEIHKNMLSFKLRQIHNLSVFIQNSKVRSEEHTSEL